MQVIMIIVFCLLTFVADGSSITMMMPFFLYRHRGNKKRQVLDYIIWMSVYALIYVFFIDVFCGFLQFATLLSLPLLLTCNGKRDNSLGSK